MGTPTSEFLAQIFLETRLLSKTLESMIGILAYLEQKLWLKKQKLGKNSNLTKGNLGCFG